MPPPSSRSEAGPREATEDGRLAQGHAGLRRGLSASASGTFLCSLPFLPLDPQEGWPALRVVCGFSGIQLPAGLVKFLLAFDFLISIFIDSENGPSSFKKPSTLSRATWWLLSFLHLYPLKTLQIWILARKVTVCTLSLEARGESRAQEPGLGQTRPAFTPQGSWDHRVPQEPHVGPRGWLEPGTAEGWGASRSPGWHMLGRPSASLLRPMGFDFSIWEMKAVVL